MTVKQLQQLAEPHLSALSDLANRLRDTGDKAEDSQQVAIRMAVDDVEKLFNGVTPEDMVNNHETRHLRLYRKGKNGKGLCTSCSL